MHRHHLDQKLKDGPLAAHEITLLGEEIAASARPTAVVFVDLTDSTLMKYQRPVAEWIGLVYEFIKRCDFLARERGGTVVKHIGDEVMITFGNVNDSDSFLLCMLGDATLVRYKFKTAIDFGEAFYLHSHHDGARPAPSCPWPAPLDPYGKVVDRCARIAALAPTGCILCSEDYRIAHPGGHEFPLAGTRLLKGIKDPCSIYYRHRAASCGDGLDLGHAPEVQAAFGSTSN